MKCDDDIKRYVEDELDEHQLSEQTLNSARQPVKAEAPTRATASS
jgi:hypothetical protein